MKLRLSQLLFTGFLLQASTAASAGEIIFKFGPPSLGQGGANPLGIPPGSTDIELTWRTESNWETSLSVSPGLTIGKRHDIDNFYVGLGGGLIVDSNGVGPGAYSSFGWESSGSFFRYGIEYKQALGLASAGLISPSALRASFGFIL